MIWFSAESALMWIRPSACGPIAMPATRNTATSGILIFCANRPATVPIARMRPQRQQRVPGDLEGGGRFQWAVSCGRSDSVDHDPADPSMIFSDTRFPPFRAMLCCGNLKLLAPMPPGAGRPFPAVFGVLTGGLWAADRMYNGVSPIRLFKAARDVSNHCPDRICGPCGRRDHLVCAAGARADRQYLFRSGAASARQHSPRQSTAQQPDDEEEVPELPQGRLLPTPNRPLPPGQGVPAPGAVQSQPLAPPPGTTVIPQNTPPGVAVAPPQPNQGVAVAPPGAVPAAAGTASAPRACRRRRPTLQPGDEVVTEPPAQKIVNKKASFSGPRQDHRAHHQFRRGYRRDRPVRRAAGQDRRLLHASGHRGRQHRRLCRGRRDHAAGRGEADFFGLDVCGKPRPARRRASDLRYLADRLQSPRCDRRQRAARSAETAPPPPAAQKRPPAARNSRPCRVRRRRRNSSSSRNRRRRHSRHRSSSPAACSGFSGSELTPAERQRVAAQRLFPLRDDRERPRAADGMIDR